MLPTNLNIELWDINRLRPYARNPRQNDHAVDPDIKTPDR